jgi:hypothetical protein
LKVPSISSKNCREFSLLTRFIGKKGFQLPSPRLLTRKDRRMDSILK